MAVTVLLSPGGSPGVTTTALALAMTWPRPVVLAECDPRRHGSVLPGLWHGHANSGKRRASPARPGGPARPARQPPRRSSTAPCRWNRQTRRRGSCWPPPPTRW